MFGFIGKFLQSFEHVSHNAVKTLLPFVEKGIGDFITNALPVAETLVIDLIKSKGAISDADRNAAATQLRTVAVASAEGTAVQVTEGISKWLLDTAYQKLKFQGAIVPSGSTANVGIAPTKVDPSTVVSGPAAVPTH